MHRNMVPKNSTVSIVKTNDSNSPESRPNTLLCVS